MHIKYYSPLLPQNPVLAFKYHINNFVNILSYQVDNIERLKMSIKKIKTIESKKDAIIFLNQLIILVYKRMDRLKRSISDLSLEINKYDESSVKIKTEIFNRISESIECNTLYLYNLFGDETNAAASYVEFRKIIEKKAKQGHNEFLLDKLDNNIKKLLNEFRNVRNWSHHIPQSLFISQISYMEDQEKIPSQMVELQFSSETIPILIWDYHELEWLYNLRDGASEIYDEFQKVFQCMKKDYSKLIGNNMSIAKEYQTDPRPYKFNSISENSFRINTSKTK